MLYESLRVTLWTLLTITSTTVGSNVSFVKVLRISNFGTYERSLWLTLRVLAGHFWAPGGACAGLWDLNDVSIASESLWGATLAFSGKFCFGQKNIIF